MKLYGIAFRQKAGDWLMSRYLFNTNTTARKYAGKLKRKGYKVRVAIIDL